jgi:predicted kinase
MNESTDVSKRFLADFIAARLRARQIEKDVARRPMQDQGLEASTCSEEATVTLPRFPTTPHA